MQTQGSNMLNNQHEVTRRLVHSNEQLNSLVQQRNEYPNYLFDDLKEEQEKEDSKVFELGYN